MSDMVTQTPHEALENLPQFILLSLARNESAGYDYRKAAVEILIDKGFPEANHPELAVFALQIRKDRASKAEVEAIVEAAIEDEIPEHPSGPLRASFTTKNMFQTEVVRSASSLNSDALVGE